MTGTKAGQSIEGQCLLLQTRQIFARRPEFNSQISQLVYRFKLGINSLAKIETELDPKKPIFTKSPFLNKGDGLVAKSIVVLSTEPVSKTVTKGSGKHNATFATATGLACAKIEVPKREHNLTN